jgi:hypothetical protein
MPSLNVVRTEDLPLLRDPQRRAREVAAIRRLAAKVKKLERPGSRSIAAILSVMHHDRPDHIALAIGAHRLLVTAVAEDVQCVGQAEPAQAQLLTALVLYLDAEGWNIGAERRFYPASDPRRLRSEGLR